MDPPQDPKLLKIVNTTKAYLGKHITKPSLAEKYLVRPPFRFLLEIITNVVQQTGFMKDTFTPQDLKYDEIATPEEKRNVLKKAIDAIEKETGEKCTARTSKILSGKEADKTNEMLQLLAKAISSHVKREHRKSDEAKVVKDTSLTTTGSEAGESRKGKDDHKTKKSKNVSSKVSTSAAPAARKTSSRTKGKIPGNKLVNPVKPSSTAVPKSEEQLVAANNSSKESIKSSKSMKPSASALNLPQKKHSALSLQKSQSRQSVSSKISLTRKDSPQDTASKEEGERCSEHDIKLPESEVRITSSSTSNCSASAMPPANSTQVPKERPVTRTKFRQKTNEADANTNAVVAAAAAAGEPPQDVADTYEEVDTAANPHCSSSNTLVKDNSDLTNYAKSDQIDVSVLVSHTKTVVNTAEEPVSDLSSSSDEIITEHMNHKISEWRASSAEAGHRKESNEVLPPANLNDVANSSAWVREKHELDAENDSKIPTRKVFASEESCTAEENEGKPIPRTTPCSSSVLETANPEVESARRTALFRPVTVLRDNEPEDEDDDTFLIRESMERDQDMAIERLQQNAIVMKTTRQLASSKDVNNVPLEHRGLLVNQILETQRELEKLSNSGKGRILQTEMEERDKAAVREVYLKQIEDLKAAIQKMSKCANPLANVIQRSQDDACLMEIEFRKLRQENERLQKMIDEAQADTSRALYPLTEELAQLDNRIAKVDGAIILAKQRLSLIDSEYSDDFIRQLENTPTQDEAHAGPLQTDPIWQYRNCEEDISSKSLLDVFRRAMTMHDGLPLPVNATPKPESLIQIGRSSSKAVKLSTTPKKAQKLLNTTIVGDDSPMGRRSNRILRQLEQEQPATLDKENKPSWWD